MSYIWQEYNKNKKFKIPEKILSPYVEVWDNERDIVEVNSNYRFSNIFKELINYDNFQDIELHNYKDEIINIIFHFLVYLDKQKGFDKEIVILKIIEDEIIKGLYGEDIKKYFQRLNEEDKKIILRNLKKYNEAEQRKDIFMDVIKEIFVYASIYDFQEINKTILCIFQEKNEINAIKYELICELFLDTRQKIEVVWNKKIGIIGNKNNMKIGQFIIY